MISTALAAHADAAVPLSQWGTATHPDASVSALLGGDTAWTLTSTALVLLMTPGLAFFYAGMVRSKNVLSVIMQSFVACGLITVQWVIYGYSLAFGPDKPIGPIKGVVGDLSWVFLHH